jgi:hypothetical protein
MVQMLDRLNEDSRKWLLLYCCNGTHCHGDDPDSRLFFQCIPGLPMADKVVIWLKMGRDEDYVMSSESPSNDEAHWKVVETLRFSEYIA